jgi:putative transposase
MIAFIADHRQVYGVEPICKVLPVAPATYHAHAARPVDPGRLPARARSDMVLMAAVRRVFEARFGVYGVRKVWRQLARERVKAARCTVARLVRHVRLQGLVRGRKVCTPIAELALACPLDHVNRPPVQGTAARRPVGERLHLGGDLSASRNEVAWSGFVYVAFVIDTYARHIVGWRVSRTARTSFVLDALEQALHQRRPVPSRPVPSRTTVSYITRTGDRST